MLVQPTVNACSSERRFIALPPVSVNGAALVEKEDATAVKILQKFAPVILCFCSLIIALFFLHIFLHIFYIYFFTYISYYIPAICNFIWRGKYPIHLVLGRGKYTPTLFFGRVKCPPILFQGGANVRPLFSKRGKCSTSRFREGQMSGRGGEFPEGKMSVYEQKGRFGKI